MLPFHVIGKVVLRHKRRCKAICFMVECVAIIYSESEVLRMKKRNWMNKLSSRAMGMMAAMALMVTATTVNQCCMWFLGQDEMPKDSEKLRRF